MQQTIQGYIKIMLLFTKLYAQMWHKAVWIGHSIRLETQSTNGLEM